MEDFKKVEIETDDPKLNEKISELNDCYFRTQRVFAKVCYKVYDIFDYCANNYYKVHEPGYDRLVKYDAMDILANFGFSKKEVVRYVSCCKKFITATCMKNACVKPMFELYSPGKLLEMLPYEYNMLINAIKNEEITSEMSCKELRETLKELSKRTDKTSKVYEDPDASKSLEEQESELLDSYDPKVSHDLAYFKQFDKATLIDFLFMAEDYIKKLSKNKKMKEKNNGKEI